MMRRKAAALVELPLARLAAARKPGRSAFTLVELLVVIAILSLLISIMVPSLRRAKEKARQAVCTLNERSLALSISIYGHDFKAYPRGHWHLWGQYKWHQPVIEGGYLSATFEDYPPEHSLHCPSNPERFSRRGITYSLSGIYYGSAENGWMSGISAHRVSTVTRPSLSFMLMELSFATDWRNGYDGNYPLTWIHSQWDVGVFHGGCNVVFCDEHVQLLTEDWRDDFEGLQPMPMPDAAGCPPYFYAFRDRTRYRDRW